MRVLVLGAGTIGLLAALVAADGGASAVGITARYPQQRTAAEAMGATEVYDPDEMHAGSPAAQRGWDVVVETVGGSAPTLQQAVDVARPGGTIVLLGVHTGAQPLNTLRLFRFELTIAGSFCYDRNGPRDDYEDTIALLARYQDRVAPLVTHTYPLASVAEAFATALDKRSGAIKVTILP
jgi:threonine dehydrogenase-like Zn-dependent dehydrogenase